MKFVIFVINYKTYFKKCMKINDAELKINDETDKFFKSTIQMFENKYEKT